MEASAVGGQVAFMLNHAVDSSSSRRARASLRVPRLLSNIAILAALAATPLGLGCAGSDGSPDPDGGVDLGGDMAVFNPDQSSTCATGTQDADGDGTCLPDCSATACEHGACSVSSDTGVASCACDDAFSGAACDTLVVPSAADAAFWIDAANPSSLTYHSDRYVSQWEDLSAASVNGTSADVAGAPQRVDGALNGLPVIRFDGTDDELVFPDVAAFNDAGGAYTMFLVVKATPVSSGQVFLGTGSGGDEAYLTALEGSVDHVAFTHAPSLAYGATEVEEEATDYGDSGWQNEEFHLVTVRRTREGLAIWIDGNNMIGEFDVFNEFSEQLMVDALTLTFSPSADRLAMDIAEMVVVADGLHYGERKPWEDYLAAKWFGAAFERTPTAFGEATIWLDASRTADVYLASGDVTAWANNGIRGGAFDNGSFASSRPTYEPTGLNGRPTIRFDGSDALVQNSVLSEDGVVQGEYTHVIVLDPPSTGAAQMVYRALNAQDDELAFELDVAPTIPAMQYRHFDWHDGTGIVDALNAPFEATAPRVVLVEYRADGRITVRVDGTTTSLTGTADIYYLQSNFHWALGGEALDAPGANALAGAVSEFIVLDNRLDAAEEEALVAALRAKWGI